MRPARRAATVIPSAELVNSALVLHILGWHCATPIGPVDTAVTKMDKNENEILKLDQNDREIKSIAVKWGFSEIGSLCPRIPESITKLGALFRRPDGGSTCWSPGMAL